MHTCDVIIYYSINTSIGAFLIFFFGAVRAMGVFTLKSCTPITANMNCRRYVTNIMLPIVLMATITHFTTYFCPVIFLIFFIRFAKIERRAGRESERNGIQIQRGMVREADINIRKKKISTY